MSKLLSIDIESTGTNPATDRIVQLAIVDVDGVDARNFLINPGVPIPPVAISCHGITDEMVADCPPFKAVAKEVASLLFGNDLLGFNILNFDVPILWEELYRAGIEWNLTGVNIIDAGVIFKKMQPRTLDAAVKIYCDREHEDAHDAVADALATWNVLCGQRLRHAELSLMSNAELAKLSQYDERPRIDIAGKLVRDADGDAVFNFGKPKGVKVKDDLGFARWMLGKDFSANTLIHLQNELDAIHEKIMSSMGMNEDHPF